MKKQPFEIVPSSLTTDASLSMGARALYPLLLHLAWTEGRKHADEEVELPSIAVIAAAAGCSSRSLKTYVAELRRAGWVETRRAARGRPQRYLIRASREAKSAPQDDPRGEESAPRVGQYLPHSRARDPLPDLEPDEEPAVPVPTLVKIGGRNLGWDALADTCRVSANGGRAGEVSAALNGRKRPAEAGIRRQFWDEVVAWAVAHDQLDRVAEEFPGERFEQALAKRIPEKAALYADRMPPGSMLTPGALRKYWTDLDAMPAATAGVASSSRPALVDYSLPPE